MGMAAGGRRQEVQSTTAHALSTYRLACFRPYCFFVKTECLNGALVLDSHNAPAVFDLVSLKVNANLFRRHSLSLYHDK